VKVKGIFINKLLIFTLLL